VKLLIICLLIIFIFLAKEKLAKVADDVKASGKRKFKLFQFWFEWNIFLAQNFANDAVKATQEYAQEGVKQGEQLAEKAFELGKDKGEAYIYFLVNDHNLLFVFIYS
jgi:hypothetical protein